MVMMIQLLLTAMLVNLPSPLGAVTQMWHAGCATLCGLDDKHILHLLTCHDFATLFNIIDYSL